MFGAFCPSAFTIIFGYALLPRYIQKSFTSHCFGYKCNISRHRFFFMISFSLESSYSILLLCTSLCMLVLTSLASFVFFYPFFPFLVFIFVLLHGRYCIVFVWLCNLCWQCKVDINNLSSLTWLNILEYGSLYTNYNFQTNWYRISISNITLLWL